AEAAASRRRLDGCAALPARRRRARASPPARTAQLTKRRERLVEALLRLEDSLEQVAVLLDPLEDDIHRERGRIEIVGHLVPAERRRDRRARPRPYGVDGGDRLPLAVLVRVDQHAAPLALGPLRRREAAVHARDCGGDDLRELARVDVAVAALDRHE